MTEWNIMSFHHTTQDNTQLKFINCSRIFHWIVSDCSWPQAPETMKTKAQISENYVLFLLSHQSFSRRNNSGVTHFVIHPAFFWKHKLSLLNVRQRILSSFPKLIIPSHFQIQHLPIHSHKVSLLSIFISIKPVKIWNKFNFNFLKYVSQDRNILA